MGYVTAVAEMVAQRRAIGETGVTAGTLLLARLADTIDPTAVDAVNGNFRFRAKRIDIAQQLYVALNVPGVRFREPFHLETPGELQLTKLGPYAGRFTIADLSGYQDPAALEIGRQLDRLWDQKLRPAGFFTPAQVEQARAAIAVGFLAFPISQKAYAATFASLPPALQAPVMETPARQSQWELVCELFAEAVKAYNAKNMAVAKAQLAAAEAWTGWTELAYVAVEAVRDLPFTVVGGVLGALGTKNLILLGVVGLVVAAVFVVPKLGGIRAALKV